MRIVLGILLCCFSGGSNAQTFDWWARVVNWDGLSHWSRYMIIQPGYLGPNALPVPRIGNGSIDSNSSVSATAHLHFSKGDNTQNPGLYANYCLVKNLISFDIAWVPYEHFTMSHAIKEKRHVFSHFYYDRETMGDAQLNTSIRLLNKWQNYVQLALRIGYRFPTGSGFGAARYSDGPGYYFDLSFGKPFHNKAFKWIGMLGFYSWQIVSDRHRQNDAFLFGTGLEWNKRSWRVQTDVSGYLGYMENSGDNPVIYRANLEKKLKRCSLLFGFQQGLHDFVYSSVAFGGKYNFK